MIATSIEQSQHLLRLGLDPSTADMCFEMYKGNWTLNVGKKSAQVNRGLAIPAWSLSALLKQMERFDPVLIYDEGDCFCRCDEVESEYFDDPVTAAYDVLCWLLENDAFDKPEPLKPIFKEDDIITDGETCLIILDVDKENQRYHVHEINDGSTWLLPFSSQTTWKIDE